MEYGLSNETIIKIQNVFAKYNQVERVILYGSRAKGNYKESSDIDLTMIGENLNLDVLQKIELDLDDLFLPYKIDLSELNKINNEDLVEHIKRVGINFYIKTK